MLPISILQVVFIILFIIHIQPNFYMLNTKWFYYMQWCSDVYDNHSQHEMRMLMGIR